MSDKPMPMQPIRNGRFVPNRIVQYLLEVAPIGLNELAAMDFSAQERMQFAQLIAYSVGGFGELSYTDNETYETALQMAAGIDDEKDARIAALRIQLDSAKKGVKDAAVALFMIHPDSFGEED